MSFALHYQNRFQTTVPIGTDRRGKVDFRRIASGQAVFQRKEGQCACGGDCPKCMASTDAVGLPASTQVQHKAIGSGSKNASNASLNLGTSAGSPMPKEIHRRAEVVLGADLDSVRFHNDSDAHHSAAQLQARAFTTGQDVYFGGGWYQPNTEAGLHLIGHELTHVVQQRRGLSASRVSGVGDEYEVEADRAGDAFARYEPAQVTSGGGSESQAVQRSADPGADAERGADADSPHGFPFLGMANTYSELVALVAELSTMEGGALVGLVPETFAMGGGGDAGSKPVAAAPAEPATEETPVQANLLANPIQRAVVAGCNVPSLPANVIGMAAHMQIGATCGLTAPGCVGGGHPGFQIPGAGRPDIVRRRPPFIDEVGEIKPASWLALGLQPLAAAQLAADLASYIAIIGPAVPMWSFAFPGAPFVLNPSQVLRAWGPSGGLYFYSCTGGVRRRVRIPVRVPSPVPVTVPVPAPSRLPSGSQVVGGVAAVGAGIGIGYLIYRGVRLIPSVAIPPLWPTIPANLAIP
jgi:hypothetical protein